jgi:hypothetical protein
MYECMCACLGTYREQRLRVNVLGQACQDGSAAIGGFLLTIATLEIAPILPTQMHQQDMREAGCNPLDSWHTCET